MIICKAALLRDFYINLKLSSKTLRRNELRLLFLEKQKMIKLIVAFVILLSIVTCKTTKKVDETPMPDFSAVDDYAAKTFGDNFELIYNEDKNYVIALVKHKRNSADPFPTIRFEILKVDGLEKLHKDNVPGAKIKWQSNQIVEVRSVQAIPRPDGTIKKKAYSFNVMNKIKLPIR